MILSANKFGFYQVNDRQTFSKFEALEWSKQQKSPILWNFNEEIFSQYDWTLEPTVDLWELYKQRARQIRDQYDYCVIWYSGGADSHNMLMAWIEAGCKIDEIAVTWDFQTTGQAYNHHNSEISHVVIPDIKTLKDKGLKFKFRLIDIPELSLSLLDKFSGKFEYYVNHYASVNSGGKSLLREHISDYQKIIENKKLAFIWGKDKPFINYENNKYFSYFFDDVDNCINPYVQQKYNQGWYDELFYWTPDLPLLPIKQAHIIKNFLRICNDENFYQKNINATWYNAKLNKWLKMDVLKKLIYPKWSLDTFVESRTPSYIFSERDTWLWKSNSEKVNQYKKTIKYYLNNIDYGDSSILPEQAARKRIVPFYSKKYWLE